MTISLPEPIAAYFAADKLDGAAVARCFNKNAIVKDEGRTYAGVVAIRKWKDDASAKYRYTVEPFAIDQRDGATVVSSHLEGTFPGGKADLRYFFRLERGKIASLEILP